MPVDGARSRRRRAVRASTESEATIERRFFKHVQRHGCVPLKLTLHGNRGWPDRLVLAPGARTFWVEFKRPGKQPTPLQRRRHRYLRALGFETCITDSSDYACARFDRWLHDREPDPVETAAVPGAGGESDDL